MLTLKLSHTGNSLCENNEEGQVDPSKFRVVDFVDIEEGKEVVSFAVNTFLVRLMQVLARPDRHENGWSYKEGLALKEEGTGVRITAREGSLCRPFTVPLSQVELLHSLDRGTIERQQMIDLAKRLRLQ